MIVLALGKGIFIIWSFLDAAGQGHIQATMEALRSTAL